MNSDGRVTSDIAPEPATDDLETASRLVPRPTTRTVVQWAGLVAGPVLALGSYYALEASSLSQPGRATAAVAVWMAVWWLTEAVEIPVTALLPLLLFPLVGAASIGEASAPYANELIFLFLGGFVLALSMQRWGLDTRIALFTFRTVGERPHHIIGGFMVATAVMSMWVSNTATVAMMMPIAVAVGGLVGGIGTDGSDSGKETTGFTVALLLGVAYSASIGGMATIIGSPPNLFVVSFIRDRFGTEIGFVQWMLMAVPLVAVFLPLGWLLLTRILHPVGRDPIPGAAALAAERYARLGPPKPGEWVTLVVFSLTAMAWMTRPLLVSIEVGGVNPLGGLTDTGIAIAAAVALFVIPVDPARRIFTMDWNTARRLPWGILILFGGGLSLAAAIEVNGVGSFLGAQAAAVAGLPPLIVVGSVALVVVLLTELTSNTATTATLAPILAGMAPAVGVHPYLVLIPVAMAASAAFMLPVATPPNAIVFASERITIAQMARAGIWLNLVGVILITVTAMLLVPAVLGVGR